MSRGKHRKPSPQRGRKAVVTASVVGAAGAGMLFDANPASAAVISDASIAQAAQSAGLQNCRGIPVSTWVAIALAESGGNTTARATSGEDSRGLWQINMRAHASWVGSRNLYDPNVNAWAAKRVCDMQGPNAWTVYSKGIYKQYLGRGAAAAAAVSGGSTTVAAVNNYGGTAQYALTAPDPGHNAYLRMGSRGSDVRALQQKLANLGYPIAVDGVFGPQTNHMVIDFQKKNWLSADGIVGPQTHGKLFH